MTFPKDDLVLVEFLRNHRPAVPPADPDLEDQILAAVAREERVLLHRQPSRFRPSRPWMLSGAIAAGLVATVIGYQSLQPRSPAKTELAQLEAFIETNWQATAMEDTHDTELVFTALPPEPAIE